MSEVVIRADNIKKSFRHYKNNWQKIQHLLLMRDVGRRERIIRGMSFEIRKGEKVGIIGRSFSGRSTLMRIIAGALMPDSGTIEVTGQVTPVLDYKMGFINVLSGRDNYKARCRLMGWNDEQIKEHEEAVYEFAGVSKEVDKPLKLFRKGHANRLGFAIATEFKPDILVFDEGFGFGSNAFLKKAITRLEEISEGDTTMVMTVNRKAYSETICTRGIVMHKGKVVFDGPFADAIDYYDANCKPSSIEQNEEEGDRESRGTEEPSDEARSEDGSSEDSFNDDDGQE